MALIEQSGGGVGFDFSGLRPKGDIVSSTKGEASGPVSFMRVFDVATDVIKQGGKRRGAMMGILRVDHPDIVEFILAKTREGILQNFNLSVAITDEFMIAVEKNREYELINPRTKKPVRRIKARKVWNLIVEGAWKTGDPGVIFIDEINRHNPIPELGKITATNPCVSGDTLVNTDIGLMRIKDLHNPRKILCLDGKYRKINWCGKTGLKEVFKVETKAGYEVEATIDHKFLTSNGEWKKVSELSKKDRLVILKGGQFGDLHVKKELALMLGWLVGDGYITKNIDDVVFIFNKKEKLEMLPLFKKYLDKLNKKPVKPTIRKTEVSLKYSSKIAKIFYDLGLRPLPADKKEVPHLVFRMDKESVKHFLSALFGADGSVQGNRRKGVSIRLTSASLKLLKQVQILLLQFGILSKIYKFRKRAGWKMLPDSKRRLKKYLCKASHELVITRESMFKFMEEIGFCLSEKNKKFHSIKPLKVYRDNIDLSVLSIERIGKKEVFDLTEPMTHSFLANGLVVHNCGEQPLLPYESCNLGSINLSRMIENGNINWEKLRKTVRIAVHFLDNVIDANKFPLPEIERMTKANRKIGLGVMGFADMLIKLGIPYNSKKALKLAEKVMKFITNEARKMSVELGLRRGSFPNFDKSVWKKKYKAMRNATVTTIAPTGSISIIAGCSSGIEPLFAVSFMRNVLEGTRLFEVNPLFERIAKEKGFYSVTLLEKVAKTGSVQKLKEVPKDVKRIFVTAFDIKPEWHVRMQAAFQRYVDNAVSKTINLPFEATRKDVEKALKLAYRLKCKGITVYRYGSKTKQVLYIGKHLTAGFDYSGGCPKVCHL
jgi:ribonucleoside-diphosphate reductase alpha chain